MQGCKVRTRIQGPCKDTASMQGCVQGSMQGYRVCAGAGSVQGYSVCAKVCAGMQGVQACRGSAGVMQRCRVCTRVLGRFQLCAGLQDPCRAARSVQGSMQGYRVCAGVQGSYKHAGAMQGCRVHASMQGQCRSAGSMQGCKVRAKVQGLCRAVSTGVPKGARLVCKPPPPDQPLAPNHCPRQSRTQGIPAAPRTHILASLSVLQAT